MSFALDPFPGQTGLVTDYPITFGYISADDIEVTVDGVSTAFTLPTSSTVRISPAPTGDVVIKRSTPITTKQTVFVDGSVQTASLHNTQNDQLLYGLQESADTAESALRNDGIEYDAESKQIKNVADPTDVQDAATKAYVDTTVAPALAAQAAAVAAQAAAEAAQTSAETAETNAETAETNAAASETAAGVSETNAAASYDAFDDRYLGSKTSDPTLDNDGDALIDGALYWNTTDNNMYVYDLGGTAWVTVSNNTTSVAAAASASAASTSASNASTSETNAEAAKDAAVVAQAAAEAALDEFTDTYLGAKASDPTVDNDGNPLTTGDQYFNTSDNVLKIWNGSSWQAAALSADDFVSKTSGTGSAILPAGSTAERDGSPLNGYLRYNSDDNQIEGYISGAWGQIGGGAGYFKGENGTVGSSAGDIFRINEAELNTDVTIDAAENASATGPLGVASGVTLTVSGTLVII